MTWREATLDDCALLGAMNHELIADENHRNKMGLPELIERMRGFLQGEYTAILFEHEGETVAYALFQPFEDADLYLRQFFVARGESGARAWVAKRWQCSSRKSFPPDRRVVVTALSQNERALAFWQAVGFDEYCVSFERLPQS